MIGRTNAGGSGPDFRVTSGTALPASGSEKDVFIISDVAVKTFAIVNYYPGFAAASGYTVLHTSDISGAVGVAWPRFNVFRPSGKILSCSLDGCRQYSNGAWHTREAYQFRNGKWVQFAFLNAIPEFTYTGSYEIVDDNGKPITQSTENWKIRFLTSGTLTFKELRGAESGIDVFLVGGGGSGGNGVWSEGYVQDGRRGGGGGSGYTATYKNVSVSIGSGYTISIGAGGGSASGSAGLKGGNTTAFGKTASGGEGTKGDGTGKYGGNGGSGGGNENYDGGSNGANGGGNGGTGQGTTTREFGAASGTLYATGGSGKSFHNGGANTGDGGSGGMYSETVKGGKGGSGIVIIRNARG